MAWLEIRSLLVQFFHSQEGKTRKNEFCNFKKWASYIYIYIYIYYIIHGVCARTRVLILVLSFHPLPPPPPPSYDSEEGNEVWKEIAHSTDDVIKSRAIMAANAKELAKRHRLSIRLGNFSVFLQQTRLILDNSSVLQKPFFFLD